MVVYELNKLKEQFPHMEKIKTGTLNRKMSEALITLDFFKMHTPDKFEESKSFLEKRISEYEKQLNTYR